MLTFIVHCPYCSAVVARVDVTGDDWHEAESWAFLAANEHFASCPRYDNAGGGEPPAESLAQPVPGGRPSIPEQLDAIAREPHTHAVDRQLAQDQLDAGLADALSTAGATFSTVDPEFSTEDPDRG